MATEKIVLKVIAETDKATKDVEKVGEGAQTSAKETTLLSLAMGKVNAAMLTIKKTSKVLFGSIKAGIISTGVGALVIAFVSLLSYFTKTKKGAEQLQVVFAGIGAFVDVIVDRISKFGGAILKIFSGDLTGALSDAKDAFSGVGDEISREVEAAMRLKKEFQELTDLTRDFGIEKAQTRQEIEKARLAAEDETLSAEQRLENLQKALDLEEQTTNKELELQRRRVAAKEEEVALGESLEDDLQALADEKVRLIELETASVKMRRRVITEVNALEREIAAEEKARADKRRARYKARKKQREAEEKELRKLNEAIELLEITDADERAKRALEIQRQNEIESAKSKKNSKEQIKAINEKYDLLELERQRKINEKLKTEQDKKDEEDLKKQKENADKLLELQRENTLQSIEDENLRKLADLEFQKQKEIESIASLENAEALKAEIVKKYENLKREQIEKTNEIEIQNQLAALGGIRSALSAASGFTEEGTKKWKQIKTAEALISTFLGVQQAYTSTIGIPIVGPFLAPVNAGLAFAAGMSRVEKIRNTEIPAAEELNRGGIVGGYGSTTSDSVNARLSKGEAVINARSAQMFRGALSSMNVAGGGVAFAGESDGAAGAGVIKTYVLSDEMTSAQDRDSKIKRRSSI